MKDLTLPLDPNFLESLYDAWKKDNQSVAPEWNKYFKKLHSASSEKEPESSENSELTTLDMVHKQSRVDSLLWAFRDTGYFYANLDPLSGDFSSSQEELFNPRTGAYEFLTPEAFGLKEEDMELNFSAGRSMEPSKGTLKEILEAFRQTYCSSIGVEFLHIQNKLIRHWLIGKMESTRNRTELSLKKKQIILKDLIMTNEFEKFLHSSFIGQKRFSLEGAEVVVPALHFLVDNAKEFQVEEIVIGMSHRGRLAVLNRILNKPVEEIFTEFEDNYQPGMYGGSGDVKYHLGYSVDHVHHDGSSVHVSLVSNPSHLEAIDPIVEGKTRGKQRSKAFSVSRRKVLPVILHGDAAFSGQGVVAETFNLSQLRGYRTGGTIHIIINNQIGFTTSARDARSTFFPTDVAKMMPVPIFHVNGDDPEAVTHVINLAIQYRQQFAQDVVVDIFCFRRHGHNEGDEPSFTNAQMYKLIKKHPGVTSKYGKYCAETGTISEEEQTKIRNDFRKDLRKALKTARENPPEPKNKPFQGREWKEFQLQYSHETVATGVEKKILSGIVKVLTTFPEGHRIHPKLKRIINEKQEKLKENGTLDWAFAEALAFGTLLLEGYAVRLSGQDVSRGTFSQRHAIWWDVENPEKFYIPLNKLSDDQAPFVSYDSPLSEFAVLGFEYGYSIARPKTLVAWEAQFGDFCNGAQVIIDNIIVSAESKWNQGSGLVMLLPHGHEGQGPEHTSAHLERFLQLCAEDNIQVCNPTTPAQYFHLLRRQMKRKFRKP